MDVDTIERRRFKLGFVAKLEDDDKGLGLEVATASRTAN